MVNALDSYLERIKDDELRKAIAGEVAKLRGTKELGLVFERHLPEGSRLLTHPVVPGTVVQERANADGPEWVVEAVVDGVATLRNDDGTITRPVADLVVYKAFGEPIYPGLALTGRVLRGGDKPAHLVINGENYHALETLLFAFEGKVDAIYIDPPYNTGARDWKYNNDYVDDQDAYRHSKWLSFIEKRLRLAKRLLNPESSVLIFTIDEKEYLRAGLLLEDVFRGSTVQMVSTVTNPKGVTRGAFRRVDEYIFFVFVGSTRPARLSLSAEWAVAGKGVVDGEEPDEDDEGTDGAASRPDWTSMMRRGSSSRRADRPTMFYPIYVDPAARRVVEVGQPLADGVDTAPVRRGLTAVLPLRRNGAHGRWQIGREELLARLEQGRIRVGRATAYGYVINYLPDGAYADVLSENFEVTGRARDGSLVAYRVSGGDERMATTTWRVASHNASEYGTGLLAQLLPGRSFPYPKSLYAVEDALRFFVSDKPDALVLDFFAGSGTTAHAVMRLNHQDGGRRRAVVVTNNEVSADEQAGMRSAGLAPGDADWERAGICEYITKPRLRAAIEGTTPDGDRIIGDYRFADEFPMAAGLEENAEFFDLTYLPRDQVERGKAFGAIEPLLWLQAGGVGERITEATADFAAPEGANYAVLFDAAHWREFARVVDGREDITHVFVVTDSRATYQQVLRALPPTVKARMLYESYLTNFTINTGATAE